MGRWLPWFDPRAVLDRPWFDKMGAAGDVKTALDDYEDLLQCVDCWKPQVIHPSGKHQFVRHPMARAKS